MHFNFSITTTSALIVLDTLDAFGPPNCYDCQRLSFEGWNAPPTVRFHSNVFEVRAAGKFVGSALLYKLLDC